MPAAAVCIPPSARVSSKDWIQSYKNREHQYSPSLQDSSVFDDAEEGEYSNPVRIPSIDPALRLASLSRMTSYDVMRNGAIDLEALTASNDWLQTRILSGHFSTRLNSHDILNQYGLLSRANTAEALLQSRTNVSPAAYSILAACELPQHRTVAEAREFVREQDVKETDVLCGRGGKSNHHGGNKRYRQVIGELRRKYRGTCAKNDKTALSRAIVDYVNGYGGRFLKRDKSGQWMLLTKGEARKKTAQALRETKELKWTE
jgi:hypothetical protein